MKLEAPVKNIPWRGDRCILCLEQRELTSEHPIPESLGGVLEVKFLCQCCNSELGSRVDAQAKRDPAIKCGISNVAHTLQENVRMRLLEGLAVNVLGPGPDVTASFKKGRLKTRARKLEDSSRIEHTSEAMKQFPKALEKEGLNSEEISAAVSRFEQAPDNEVVEVSPTITAIKWPIESIELSLSGEGADFRFPLKIAYEFLALHVGVDIYAPEIQPIRDAIRSGQRNEYFQIERGFIEPYGPWHGVKLVETNPCVFAIHLFGAVAFRVHLPISYDGAGMAYAVDLDTRTHRSWIE